MLMKGKRMLLSDKEIMEENYLMGQGVNQMILPFSKSKNKENGMPSSGLSSYGYDIKLAYSFIEFINSDESVLDFPNVLDPTKEMNDEEKNVILAEEFYVLFPGNFVLAHSVEYFNMPKNITGLVKDKSTYARCGIALQNTVLEAGWSGQITLEISNHSPRPVKLYCNAGIAQVLFFRGNECLSPYDGKYQGDTGVVTSKKG